MTFDATPDEKLPAALESDKIDIAVSRCDLGREIRRFAAGEKERDEKKFFHFQKPIPKMVRH